MAARRPIRVGTVLRGYCGGEFGRDSYENKTVEGLGTDWVVAREESGLAVFANVKPEKLEEYTLDDCE